MKRNIAAFAGIRLAEAGLVTMICIGPTLPFGGIMERLLEGVRPRRNRYASAGIALTGSAQSARADWEGEGESPGKICHLAGTPHTIMLRGPTGPTPDD